VLSRVCVDNVYSNQCVCCGMPRPLACTGSLSALEIKLALDRRRYKQIKSASSGALNEARERYKRG
jgi:hypothetical protein